MNVNLVKRRRAKAARLLIKNLLTVEGYRPRLEPCDNGLHSMVFTVEGQRFRLRTVDKDASFVQLCCGVALEEGGPDELSLLRLGHEIQAHYKGLKVHFPRSLDHVEFQIELLLDGHPLSPELLRLALVTLKFAGSAFYEQMKPEVPKAPSKKSVRANGTGARPRRRSQ